MSKVRSLVLSALMALVQGAWAQEPATSGSCGDNLTWSVTPIADSEGDLKLTISGTGDMYNFGKASAPWYDDFGSDITTIDIEDGVTSIGEYAFYDIYMTEITIPNSVNTINSYAFLECDALQTIRLNCEELTIKKAAFRECSNVGQIYCNVTFDHFYWDYYSDTKQFKSDKGTFFYVEEPDKWAARFAEANVTFTTVDMSIDGTAIKYNFLYDNGTPTLYFYKSGDGSTEIPGRGSAYDDQPSWYSLKDKAVKLMIGDGITKIGQNAFNGFTSTQTIVIGKDVELTGKYAFAGTTVLNSCTFAEGSMFTTLGEYTFQDSGLSEIELPASLTMIGSNAFESTNIEVLVVPDNVTSIGIAAFMHCRSLETVYLGTGITSIGTGAFATGYYNGNPETMERNKLADIYCPGNMNPDNWAFFDQYYPTDFESYDGNLGNNVNPATYVNDHTPRLHLEPGTDLTAWNSRFSGKNITIADDLCGDHSYGSVENGVLTIHGFGTMYDFSSNPAPWHDQGWNTITKLELSEGIESIGSYAMADLGYLSQVVIPATITRIGDNAFYCNEGDALYDESHIFMNADPVKLVWGSEVSPLGGSLTCHIHVANLADWPHDNQGDKFFDIQAIWDESEPYAFYQTTQTIQGGQRGTLTFYNDHLRLTRTDGQIFPNLSWTDKPAWSDYSANLPGTYFSSIEKVVFDPSFESVHLQSGKNMFLDLRVLTSIEGLEYLNTSEMTSMEGMFASCWALENIDLTHFSTGKVTSMNTMFSNCQSVKTLDLNSFDISKVEDYYAIFNGCGELTTIYCNFTWPKLDSWGYNCGNMFKGCSKLEGSMGTTFADTHVDYDISIGMDYVYAHPDGGSADPGYFTSVGVLLYDNRDNSTTIADNINQPVTVTLSGRTLYKDGSWNTLCLPFAVDDFNGTPLEGAIVKTLESASFNGINGTLTLNFSNSNLTYMEAGKPYIVKWEVTTSDDIPNPVFSGVTITNTSPQDIVSGPVTFHGIYSPYSTGGQAKSMLYLGDGNRLYYPSTQFTIGAFRAYFQLDGITAGDLPNQVRDFVLNFDGDSVMGISLTTHHAPLNSDSWFTLDGRMLSGKPTLKGIYINNGKKVIIK